MAFLAHTFHLSHVEMTVTLPDVSYLWGMIVIGVSVTVVECGDFRHLCSELLGTCTRSSRKRRRRVFSPFQDDLAALDDDITQEERRVALNEMPSGRASGSGGLPVEFYRVFWQVIKADVMDLITAFFHKGTDIWLVNRATITLIQKKQEPTTISNYRSISVINTIAKLITKIMTNRL